MFLHYSYMGRQKTSQKWYTVMDSPITWNDDYGKTIRPIFLNKRHTVPKKKIPHLSLSGPWLGRHDVAYLVVELRIQMSQKKDGASHWLGIISLPKNFVRVQNSTRNKKKTLGQPPPKKLQHSAYSLHFRQRSLSWDCHPSCSAIFISCHKRSRVETSASAPRKIVKSDLHPGVFIMAFDIFKGTTNLYTTWKT